MEEFGAAEREEQQYGTLSAILRTGYLAEHQGAAPGVTAYSVGVDSTPFCSNEMIDISPICFCDIPLNDLGVHMGKYGEFGLCFLKRFLIERGASPVFYVAMNAFVRVTANDVRQTRRDYFNQMVREYSPLRAFIFSGGAEPELEDQDLHQLLRSCPELRDDPAVGKLHPRLEALTGFFDAHVLGFVKCFDDQLPADSESNFYMEREWRTATRVDFTPADIAHVILPRRYERRLQQEFPAIPRRRIRLAEDCKGRWWRISTWLGE